MVAAQQRAALAADKLVRLDGQILHAATVDAPTVDLQAGLARRDLEQVDVIQVARHAAAVSLLDVPGPQAADNDLVAQLLQLLGRSPGHRVGEHRHVVVDAVESDEPPVADDPRDAHPVEVVALVEIQHLHAVTLDIAEADRPVVAVALGVAHERVAGVGVLHSSSFSRSAASIRARAISM